MRASPVCLDESKALYEWSLKKLLLRVQAQGMAEGKAGYVNIEEDILSEYVLPTSPGRHR